MMHLANVVVALFPFLALSGAFTPSRFAHLRKVTVGRGLSPQAVQLAEDLKAQAAVMRREADQLEADLTLKKIATLERKLGDSKWLEKNRGDEDRLTRQLNELRKKASALSTSQRPFRTIQNEDNQIATLTVEEALDVSSQKDIQTLAAGEVTDVSLQGSKESSHRHHSEMEHSSKEKENKRLRVNPVEGFGPNDLEILLPVALAIEQEMSNSTLAEQLSSFQEVPTVQRLFQEKVHEFVEIPLEQMQQLENLRQQYLLSSSSIEKDSIKRQIESLEAKRAQVVAVTDSFFLELTPMSDEEFRLRIANLRKLPRLLQALYARRNGLPDETDIELAVLVEHYDEQLQLIDQLRYVNELSSADRADAIRGYESLPSSVQALILKKVGLTDGASSENVINELVNGDFASIRPSLLLESPFADFQDRPEYNDIEFIERSQFAEELLPSITNMEEVLPTQEEMDVFVNKILEPKIYGLRSKPERVLGGYYVRGFNNVQEENSNDKLVARLREKVAASELSDKIQFFFISDPKALTDEEIDMGVQSEPVLIVTGLDPALFYRKSNIVKKASISAIGIIALVVFAFGTCVINQISISSKGYSLQMESLDEVLRYWSDALPVGLSLLGIQLVHEGGHQLVAWKDKVTTNSLILIMQQVRQQLTSSSKFKAGPPLFVPSFQLGLLGTVTPLESPPPNFKSLFDFALAGPLAGMVAALCLLVIGLHETVSIGLADQVLFPGLPATLVKSSALGGSLVTFFLGNGALNSPSAEVAVLCMHPFAVSGFVGLIINALALLPLGHTDGGRISLAMFGRRGAYLIKTFAAIALCFVGLIGLDESRVLITYTAFVFLSQRELEAPMLNEVDDLDDGRALLGFFVGVVVTLTLLPMP